MRTRFGMVGAMLCVGLVLLACGPTDDSGFVRATPTASSISRSPPHLRLEFRNELREGDATVQINRGGGGTIPVRLQVLQDRRTVLATPGEPLRAGTYQVVWRVTGRDGQTTTGAYDLWIVG